MPLMGRRGLNQTFNSHGCGPYPGEGFLLNRYMGRIRTRDRIHIIYYIIKHAYYSTLNLRIDPYIHT